MKEQFLGAMVVERVNRLESVPLWYTPALDGDLHVEKAGRLEGGLRRALGSVDEQEFLQ